MPKKVVKRENNWVLLSKWMKIQEGLVESIGEVVFDEKESNNRMRIAVWGLVAYGVFFTAMFLLVIYGNQYLVK